MCAYAYIDSSNRQVQLSSGIRGLQSGQCFRLHSYSVCASSRGSGETVRMRIIVLAFAGRRCDMYTSHMTSRLGVK